MSVASMNIVINLAVVVIAQIFEWGMALRARVHERRAARVMAERRKKKEYIVATVPKTLATYEAEITIADALAYCKGWIGERKWLSANSVDFSKYEEEIEFQRIQK